jgi:hypothetical protein
MCLCWAVAEFMCFTAAAAVSIWLPAWLQAAVIGLDIRRHSELAMKPGEVRPLLLSRQKPDTRPMSLPCPRPPACV